MASSSFVPVASSSHPSGAAVGVNYTPHTRPYSDNIDPSDDDDIFSSLYMRFGFDSSVSRELVDALKEAEPDFGGLAFFLQGLEHLKRSNDLSVASAAAAARAYRSFTPPPSGSHAPLGAVQLRRLQYLKTATRDLLLWRCAGVSKGLDSKDAMLRSFHEAVPHDTDNIIGDLCEARRTILDTFIQHVMIAHDRAPEDGIRTCPSDGNYGLHQLDQVRGPATGVSVSTEQQGLSHQGSIVSDTDGYSDA